MPSSAARWRRQDIAALQLSCMTSPRLPVSSSLPLPSITPTSTVQHLAADRRPGKAADQADHIASSPTLVCAYSSAYQDSGSSILCRDA